MMKRYPSYKNAGEHLDDELLKLDALLHLQVLKHRERRPGKAPDRFGGLYIAEEDVDGLTNPGKKPGNGASANKKALIDSIKRTRETLSKKIENSVKAGIRLPMHRLASMFHLSSFEWDILLFCLAPELDLKYEKLYAYLQDDVTKRSPSVNLILEILCPGMSERTGARICFLGRSPLLRYGLVTFSENRNGDNGYSKSLLSRCLQADERITGFLLGFNDMDSRLSFFAKNVYPRRDWESLVMEDKLKQQFSRLAENWLQKGSEPGPGLVFYLNGPYGAGKKSTAEAFCRRLRIPLLIVDTRDLLEQDRNRSSEADPGKTVMRLFRETLLQPAAIYFDGFDRLITPGSEGGPGDGARERAWQKRIIEAVKEFAFITFFAGDKEWHLPGGFTGQTFVAAHFAVPSYSQRKRLWEKYLNGLIPLAPGIRVHDLADKFNFTPGQIRDAVEEAGNCALVRACNENRNNAITMEDLYRACHSQSNRKLSETAQKVEPAYTWTDIVLPPDKLRQLQEICSHVSYRQVVYWEWGFGAKFSLGKGLNVLFTGPSGTGKTMSAEIIARDLGMELYKIDLSNVVSKYIGETEKNLKRIFKEAETANCILFFDEADALFGKRTEVRDSHDRYANIEINYLLQKMEEHAGIVILATNFSKNIDEAFKRRLHFSVDFPFPDEKYRLRIWRNIFPAEMPRGGDMDLEFLAKKFNLPGGNIKNIALNAAFLAAEDRQKVGMRHTLQAVKREMQKIGKHCSPSDFGKYQSLLE